MSAAELVRVADPWARLRQATAAMVVLEAERAEVGRVRDRAMVELHRSGASYQRIAAEAGLTRGRVAQIVRRSPDMGDLLPASHQ